MNKKQLAWFWTSTCCLFVGISGQSYPNSWEVALCVHPSQQEAGRIFMEQVVPYANTLISAGVVSQLFWKSIYDGQTTESHNSHNQQANTRAAPFIRQQAFDFN